MHLIIVLIVTAIAVIAFYGLVAGTAAGARIQAGFDAAGDKLAELGKRLHLFVIRNVYPMFRKAAVLTVGFMLFGFVNGVVELTQSKADVGVLTVVMCALVLTLCVVGSAYYLWRERAKDPKDFSVMSIGSTACVALFLSAFAYLAVGATMESTSMVITATGFFLAAEAIFTVFLTLGSVLVALGIEFSEGGASYALRLAINLAMNGKEGLKALKDEKVEIANEQAVRDIPANVTRRIRATAYPVFAIVMLWPTWQVLAFTTMAGLVSYLIWGYLEARFIATLARRQRSALIVEKIAMVLLFVAFVTTFVPEAKEALTNLALAAKAFLVTALGHFTRVLTDHAILLLVILLLGYAAWSLRGEFGGRVLGHDSKLRGFAAWLAGFACLGCVIALIALQVRKPLTDTMAGMKGSAVKQAVPSVEATDHGTVFVDWSDIVTESGRSARVERRGVRESGFHPVITLEPGATAYEDLGVTRGETYFYRVVFIDPKQGDVLTTYEKEVKVPSPASTPTPQPEPVTDSRRARKRTTPKEETATCLNGRCGRNPSLEELCKRHPNVKGC